MFKVNPDGSIECSTADEALDLQRRIQERTAKAQRAQEKQQPTLFSRSPGGYDIAIMDSPYSLVIKKLLEFKGTEIGSGQMAELVGAKTPAGVGPKLFHLKKKLPDLESMLEERKDEKGLTWWKVRH